MAVIWKIARVGTGEEKTLEEWQIKSGTRQLVNQGLDLLTLGFAGTDLLGNSPFASAEILRLDRVVDDVATTVFRGRLISETRGAYGSTEGLTVQFAGAWWYLENLIFMQPQAFVVYPLPIANPIPVPPAVTLSLSDFATETLTSSQIVLKEDEEGGTIDSKAQVLAALNYAISKGAPIAIGTIDDGIAIPRDLIQDATCAEIILKSLRWTPDQSIFFDYSVNPPTINIRTTANRTALAIDVADREIAEVEVNPRNDLVAAGVTINYLRSHSRESIEFVTLDKDQAGPDPEGIGALVLTLELYGSYNVQTDVAGVTQTVIIAAEDVPDGLAASLFAAYSIIQYEGRILIVKDECDGIPWTSRKLSIANGIPMWAAAEMVVQQATEDIFAGRTEITIGPPRQLGAQDILGLVRKGRTKAPPISHGYGPVLPTQNPEFPNAGTSDPRVQFGNQPQPLVIGYHHFGQDVGFPNSYGGFADDEIIVIETDGGIGHATAPPAAGAIIDFHGVRIGGLNKYHPRAEPPANGWGIRNDTFAGLTGNGPSFRVLAYTIPPTIT